MAASVSGCWGGWPQGLGGLPGCGAAGGGGVYKGPPGSRPQDKLDGFVPAHFIGWYLKVRRARHRQAARSAAGLGPEPLLLTVQ